MGTRLPLVLVSLLVMITLAGCGGLLSSNSSQAVYATPLSEEATINGNQERLQSAGSFTYRVSSTTFLQENPDQRAVTDVRAQVDLETDRAYVRQTLQQRATVEAFTAPETGAFQRQQRGDQVRYLQIEQSQVNTTAFTRSGPFNSLSEFDYQYQGATQTGDTRVHTYTGQTNSASTGALGIDIPAMQTITNARSQLNVTDAGAVREFNIQVTGTDAEGRTLEHQTRVQYAAIGATAVQTPEWVGQAQNATT